MNYKALIAHFPKMSYGRYKKLSAYFLHPENIWRAEMDELKRAGLDEAIAHEFIVWRENNPAEKLLETLEKEKITTISLGDPYFPYALSQISDPPLTLFLRGVLPSPDQPAIAIVGTRRNTAYGKEMAEDFSRALARQGVAIISGLALGIDGIAHAAALAEKGYTMAVLGSGIDASCISPPAHQKLAEQIIASGGAIVSEYPPGFPPARFTFPMRNRIVAGMSQGVLVIEAPEKSGALITARLALDYNREVFAIPHSLTSPAGRGANNLIKQGAAIALSADDIMETLKIQKNISETPIRDEPALAPNEAIILGILSWEPKQVDLLIKESGLPSAVVNGVLTMLEIKKKIRNLGGMTYAKK